MCFNFLKFKAILMYLISMLWSDIKSKIKNRRLKIQLNAKEFHHKYIAVHTGPQNGDSVVILQYSIKIM